ncbi:Sytalpha, partial [Capitella teleta]
VPSGPAHRRRRASMQDALDHTKINASLYIDRPVALQRQQSIGNIEEENLGSINFSLLYDQEQGLITVRLIQACDLVPRDFSGTADPYCRLCLLPVRRTQIQSKVHRKTLNPEFNEEFIFDANPNEISDMSLQILLYDFDQFSRDECIGEVVQPLGSLDLGEKVSLWKGITPRSNSHVEEEALGDLMFSMAYLPSAERLTVVVVKGRHLQPKDDGKTTYSPFVKVSLISSGKRVKKKKTSAKRNSANPVWNEALVFNMPRDSVGDVQVEFVVYTDNLLGNNEALGKVIVGSKSSGEEQAHWKDVLSSKKAMAMWHRIRAVDSTS